LTIHVSVSKPYRGVLNYVMTPKRIGSKNGVHKGMGLIEVDLNNLESAKAWGLRD